MVLPVAFVGLRVVLHQHRVELGVCRRGGEEGGERGGDERGGRGGGRLEGPADVRTPESCFSHFENSWCYAIQGRLVSLIFFTIFYAISYSTWYQLPQSPTRQEIPRTIDSRHLSGVFDSRFV